MNCKWLKVLSAFVFSPLFFTALSVRAQVDCDKPIPTGTSDSIYYSTQDPHSAYFFPLALVRVTDVNIAEVDGRLEATFGVGIPEQDFTILQSQLQSLGNNVKLRAFRATDAKFVSRSSEFIPKKFEPVLENLGDAASLMGPTEYRLSIKKRPRLFKESKGKKLLREIFVGFTENSLGFVDYEFNANKGGAPYLGRTRVPVLLAGSGEWDSAQIKESATPIPIVDDLGLSGALFRPMNFLSEELNSHLPSASAQSVQFVHDEQSDCWNEPRPGVICLRIL